MTGHIDTLPKILGLITARGGSKGIPGKNVAPLAGKPLISWTIDAALQSDYLDRVVVSTDADDIAAKARAYGAEVPFIRPAELAQDDSPHMETVIHAIEWLHVHDSYLPDYVMLLQPTSPLRSKADINGAARLAVSSDSEAVVSVCPSPVHPYFMKRIDADTGLLVDYQNRPGGYLPRQALETVYALNGAIYLIRSRLILGGKTWSDVPTLAYVMPESRSLDIDTPWDLHLADLIIKDAHAR